MKFGQLIEYNMKKVFVEKCPYPSNQTVFSACQKCQDKNLNILRTKRAFKMK